ncbi:MAG TPA: acetate--CoA ligase family protein, partial [Acidimicrobiales bacterium]|nr:acetate--CoA ligase family protein [Acidimicrobiales bacterium]
RSPAGAGGIATVHDSGAERALVVDVADQVGVSFAGISPGTKDKLAGLLDPGLKAENPLDLWGTGADTRRVFGGALGVLSADPAVEVTALCVDLVHEYDGDTAYVDALIEVAATTEAPLCLMTNVPSAMDRQEAERLRAAGVPVLEGTRSGLRAMGHLIGFAHSRHRDQPKARPVDAQRQRRWLARLQGGRLAGTDALALLADYGIAVPPYRAVSRRQDAVAAAVEIGWPVVLKTDEPSVAHKSDLGGVRLGLSCADEVAAAFDSVSASLGDRTMVMAMAAAGPELALGIVRDPLVGHLVIVGAGGVLVEILADRAVALPPVDEPAARRLLDRLAVRAVLAGARGALPVDLAAVDSAVAAVSHIAVELGEAIEALDVNPLRCTPDGAFALDGLVEVAGVAPA